MAGETFPVYDQTYLSKACPECRAGRYRLTRTTQLSWVQGDLLAVQNFPIWKCDLCGWRDDEPRAILWLKTLLHPPAVRAARQPFLAVGTGPEPAPIWTRVVN